MGGMQSVHVHDSRMRASAYRSYGAHGMMPILVHWQIHLRMC